MLVTVVSWAHVVRGDMRHVACAGARPGAIILTDIIWWSIHYSNVVMWGVMTVFDTWSNDHTWFQPPGPSLDTGLQAMIWIPFNNHRHERSEHQGSFSILHLEAFLKISQFSSQRNLSQDDGELIALNHQLFYQNFFPLLHYVPSGSLSPRSESVWALLQMWRMIVEMVTP